MKFLAHSLKVLFAILATPFPYGKMEVLGCYLKLVTRSVIFHKVSSRPGEPARATFTECVMGYHVVSTNYPQLINLFEEIFIFQTYQFTSSHAKPFIIDCGSHLGLSLLYFKKLYPSSTILGFEPNIRTFSLLQNNVTSNLLQSVSIHNTALAGHEGKGTLYIHPSANTLTPGLHSGGIKTEAGEVVTQKLSSFIDRQVDLLKVDVEGSEAEILRDMIGSGKIAFVRKIIMEYHPDLASAALDTLVQELTAAGFSCCCERDKLHPGATEWLVYCSASAR